MPVDSSIYSQIQQPQQQNPLAALAQAVQIQAYQQKAAQEARVNQRGDALTALLQTPDFQKADLAGKQNLLYGVGAIKEAGEFGVQDATRQKTLREADTAKLKNASDSLGILGQILAPVKDDASYQMALKQINQLGIPTPGAAAQYDPAVVEQFRMQAIPALDKLKNDTSIANNTANNATSTANNAASNATSRANNRDTNFQSEANSLRTDRRASQNAASGRVPSGYEQDPDNPGRLRFIVGGPADPNTKPAGGKPLNDTQSKALQFGSRMQEANDLFDSLAQAPDGADRPGLLKRTADGIPNALGGGLFSAAANYTQSPAQQQVEQAQRDFINAVLRRESGAAISESEFDNAKKQYFPQANDDEKAIAQKKRNREISTRGILAEVPEAESRVAAVRGKPATPDLSSIETELKRRGLLK